MSTVEVGRLGAVNGRLPDGQSIVAHFDRGTLTLTSPGAPNFKIKVDTNNMDKYGPIHQETSDQLDGHARVEAKYDVEGGILRFDSAEVLEFWVEVRINKLPTKPSKKRKMSDEPSSEESDKGTDAIMSWSKMEIADEILTFWPGTPVKPSDLEGPESLHVFFKDAFDIEVRAVGCVETLPDMYDGKEVPGTGGRHDFFFLVKEADVPKFCFKRFAFGMRWWSDVYFNNDEEIYPLDFRAAYPKP